MTAPERSSPPHRSVPEGASRWAEVRAAAESALALPTEARAAFLDHRCGADAGLRAEIDAQVQACERAGQAAFLGEPAAAFAAPFLAAVPAAAPGPDVAIDEAAAGAAAVQASLRAALAGRYDVERELGRGGTATVFLARDLRHGRRVALKVLDPALGASISAERFLREIRVTAGLTHPHVLPLHDSGDAVGLLYYVMPYIAGESLRERLARDGPLSFGDTLRLAREVASALAHAHRHGVVHRDVKPANILLADGHAVVADFGIASAVSEAREARASRRGEPRGPSGAAADTCGDTRAGAVTLTEAGMSPGTPAYMAPEQVRGDALVDHRADLYALGLVLYEALAGAHPFAGRTTPALVAAHLHETPPALATRRAAVPRALDELVTRLLAKDPAGRPASASDVLRELDAALTPEETPPSEADDGGDGGTRAPSAVSLGTVARAVRRRVTALAVLPMVNTSGDPEIEHFSDGLTDDLIGALSAVPSLRVTGRTSSFALKGKGLGVAEVARTLDVQHVLEGSVRRSGNRMKARLQLVRALGAVGGSVVWSEAFDRTLDDIFAVQEEIAQAVVRALRVRLGGGIAPLVRPSTADLVAHDLYLRGRLAARRGYNLLAAREAIGCFEQAIARDPGFAAAHAALAWMYVNIPVVSDVPAAAVAPQARFHAGRAVALDPELAAAHLALGQIHYSFDLDLPAAGRALRRALELEPGGAEIHQIYAVWLEGQRHFAEAERHARIAVAAEPLTPVTHFILGWTLMAAGRPAEGLPYLEHTIEGAPGFAFAYEILAFTYLRLGRSDDALRAARRGAEVGDRRGRGMLAYVHAVRGEPDEARALLGALEAPGEREHAPPCQMAYAYAALGEPGTAIGWLERGFALPDPHVTGLAIIPAYDSLRGDPGFQALVARLRHETPA